MSSSSHMKITMENNMALRRKVSYFKKRGKKFTKYMRIGKPLCKYGVNENAYELTRKRKAVQFRKGVRFAIVFFASMAVLIYFVLGYVM